MHADRSLGRRLLALVVASIVPLALMAGVGLYALQRWQRAESERVGIELARSVANAVAGELRAAQAMLEALSTTPSLEALDPVTFQDRARRLVAARPDWIAIVLTDASGTVLADTRMTTESSIAPPVDRDSLELVVRTGVAVVGSLTRDEGVWEVPVRVPVRRAEKTAYVVTALISPEVVRQTLQRQDVPEDWLISIVDARRQRVARSRAHEANVGGRLSESTERVVAAGGASGVGLAYSLEGDRILAPYARIGTSGWLAVLGIPTAVIDAAIFQAVALYAAGVVLSIVVATLAAVWVARTITRPVKALELAAGAMARGERPEIPETAIREIAAAGSALGRAFDDLQQASSEREQLLRAEREAREAAELSDRTKDRFLAVLSHELRTPLNAVSGWARMLQSGQLRDDPALTTRAVDVIVRNVDAQVRLIDDLLDLSRISAGKLRLQTCETDLAVVVRDVIEAVRPSADARQIALHSAISPEGVPITGDPDRLQQVVWNLVMNAVKFTPEGGSVEVRLHRRQTHAELRVRDTGRGIPADVLPRIFDAFHQADNSSTRAHSGLGLGLSLARTLVELHGGTVEAESDGEGRGATFTVTLPIAASPSARAGAAAESSPTTVRPLTSLEGLRVLIVDDDSEGLLLGEEVLRRAGADVQGCSTARRAFELLRSWRPDALVSDIEMPGEDGYQLIRLVRALSADEGGATPAVALTAYGRPQDRRRALDAGFNIHVPKPVDPGELTAIIAELVRARNNAANGPETPPA